VDLAVQMELDLQVEYLEVVAEVAMMILQQMVVRVHVVKFMLNIEHS
jgi:hypothetical protein